MKSRSCPICGSDDDSKIFAAENFDLDRLDDFAFASRKLPEYMHYRLVECPSCDLLYANPAPEQTTLGDAYREAAYDSGEEAQIAARTYAQLLDPVMARLNQTDSALDIGAGDGAFLEELINAGFKDVVGLEPSSAPIAAAKEPLRPLIRQGLFSSTSFEERRFDLITCFQTLEHLPDPSEMCRAAFSLLDEGGAVLFVCHNRRAMSARVLGLKSPIFDVEHLQLFSPRSVSNLLSRSGFAGIEVRTVTNRYPLHYWVKLFPFPRYLKLKLLPAIRKSRLGSLEIRLPAGNIVAFGYKKSEPNGTVSEL